MTAGALRRGIGAGAFATAMLLVAWLPLGIWKLVPFVLALPGSTPLRVHAAAAVACLLIAAWGYWEG